MNHHKSLQSAEAQDVVQVQKMEWHYIGQPNSIRIKSVFILYYILLHCGKQLSNILSYCQFCTTKHWCIMLIGSALDGSIFTTSNKWRFSYLSTPMFLQCDEHGSFSSTLRYLQEVQPRNVS
jgi:hypothetical protein